MKHVISRFIMGLGLVAALSSDPASAKALRFIYIQGFMSCSMSNQTPVAKFLELAASHPDARMYWGCYDGGLFQHARDFKQRFFLYSLDTSGQWSEPQEMSARTAPLEIALKIQGEISDDSPSKNADPLMDVYIAGHSHGGWMAMRIAYQLGLHRNIKIRHLLTIDPISYELCSSSWFPIHTAANSFRWWGAPSDCHQAPRDLQPIGQSIALATAGRWTNIYQNSMAFLSSGPIKHATRNLAFQANSTFDWLTAHRASLIDQRSWNIFYRDLEYFLK